MESAKASKFIEKYGKYLKKSNLVFEENRLIVETGKAEDIFEYQNGDWIFKSTNFKSE